MPLYNNAYEGVDWVNDTIKAAIYQSDFTEDLTDVFLSDIVGTEASDASYSRVTLSNKTATYDVPAMKKYYDCDDIVFSSLTEPDLNTVLIFKDTGNSSTSRLIGWIEVQGAPKALVNATATFQLQSSGLFDVVVR